LSLKLIAKPTACLSRPAPDCFLKTPSPVYTLNFFNNLPADYLLIDPV